MLHDWYPASGGGLISTMWMNNPLKVALLAPSYIPNPDTHKLWTDVSASEIAGTGYTAGGQLLAGKTTNYDAAADRTNLLANDSVWSAATFTAGFAVIYDSAGALPLWSLVNFEGSKNVSAGSFTLDWAAIGLLFVVRV